MQNHAYDFSGQGYIDVGGHHSIKRFATDFTITAWVLLKTYPPAAFPYYNAAILSNRTSTGKGSLFSIDNFGKFSLTVKGGGIAKDVASNTIVPLNKWVHLAVTFKHNGDTGNVATAYYNGVFDAVNAHMPAVEDPNFTSNGMGKELANGNTKYYLDGKLDDVRIYNRLLSATEISALAHFQTAGITSADNNTDFFNVFPNPSNTGIISIIPMKNSTGNVKVIITNISGQIIYSKNFDQSGEQIQVDISDSAKGTYFMQVLSGNKSQIRKIVLE